MNLSDGLNNISFLKSAMECAEKEDVKVFIVGGFIRDLILRREKPGGKTEIDFLVIGDGPGFALKFAGKLGLKNISIFKNFGTAHFRYNDYDLEFVGARKESYKRNSRKPEVQLGTFEDDIARRDFTINTLAVSINKNNFGQLFDTFGGLDDIKNKLIKTPVDPAVTFNDDPLRILRAYRFASYLNFNVDESINKAALQLRERLKIVSKERISDEFLKILASPVPSVGLIYLFQSGVLEIIFPEIYNLAGVEQINEYHHKDVFFHTCKVVDNVAGISDNIWLRFAALVHDIAKPQTKRFIEGTGWTFHGHDELGARMMKGIFRRMKLPFIQLHYVETLVKLHLRPIALAKEEVTDSAVRRLIVSAGDALEDLILLCRADITSKNPEKVNLYLENYDRVMQKVRDVEERDKLRAFQSPVRGDVIMKVCNIEPSRKVGEIKKAIEEAILDGKINNNYEEAFDYLLKIKDKFLDNN